MQALQTGTATADQQQRALKWIIEKVCGTYDLTYFPESARNSDFAEGKRFVGLMLRKLLRPEFDPKDKVEFKGDSQLKRHIRSQLKQGS